MFNPFYSFLFNPVIPNIQKLSLSHDEPPTIYSLLNAYVNFGKEESEQVKIKDLAKTGRGMFFDFDYPLSSHVEKEYFETLILNHYLMRRIGYETVTAFKIALSVKLSEIMPRYNKLFDAIDGWDLFESGEVVTREQHDDRNTTSDTTVNNTSDQRYSDTPQNRIQDIKDGSYMSSYNLNSDEGNTNSNVVDNGNLNETISRSPADKLKLYQDLLKNCDNIYTMIFKDLDDLFYQLV